MFGNAIKTARINSTAVVGSAKRTAKDGIILFAATIIMMIPADKTSITENECLVTVRNVRSSSSYFFRATRLQNRGTFVEIQTMETDKSALVIERVIPNCPATTGPW